MRLEHSSIWANQSFFQGWFTYLQQLRYLDFGLTSDGKPIIDELRVVFPATLELCFVAALLSLLVGIPIGTIIGMQQGKWLDTFVSLIVMICYSIPIFWLALIAIMYFSNNILLPVFGRYDPIYQIQSLTGFALIDAAFDASYYMKRLPVFRSLIEHMFLPCLIIAVTPITQVIRIMRSAVVDIMSKNYIRAARIRGLSSYRIVSQHVLKNAIPAIISRVGVQFSMMLSLTFVIEPLFYWPGIAQWLLQALEQQDYVSIQAGVMVVALSVLIINISSDIFGAIINPLVRKEWYANK